MSRDNWGWRGRIGMFIVGSEVVPEAEWWAMAPTDVSIHAARVTARAPWAEWRVDRSGVDLADDLLRGCRQFAGLRLSAVVIGHSSSSLLGGKGWDEATIAGLEAALGSGPAVTTNGRDTVAALNACNVKRPFLVLPPWFNDALLASGVRYYADHGVEPAGHMRYDPGRKWRDLLPGDLTTHGMHLEQDLESRSMRRSRRLVPQRPTAC
ncbi:MAG: hypothetical protein U1E60_07810 [Reyranellaceae bacterium]